MGADAGYAFRSQADGRNHGAAAAAFVDVPLPGPFALRPELLLLGFGPSKDAPQALGLFGAALSFVYSFDDTDVQALVALGPMGAVSVDGPVVAGRGGALASLGLRFPVAELAHLDARVSLPAVLFGPKGPSGLGQATFADGSAVDFPLQTTFVFGVVFDIEAALAGAAQP